MRHNPLPGLREGGHGLHACLTPAGPKVHHGRMLAVFTVTRNGGSEGWLRPTTHTSLTPQVDHPR
jgi:hypothetical protein